MNKYILTYYKNEIVILSLDSCNKCPLLNIDFVNKNCKCRNNSYRIVKDNIYIYDIDMYRVYEYINIPLWCGLSDNLKTLKNSNIFKVFKNTISIYKNDLNISKIKTIDHSSIYDMTRLIYDYTKSKNTNYKDYTNYEQIKKIDYKICSLCGEEDNSVDRNINYGMCDTCWETSKNNEYNKRTSHINNFRLKRNIGIKSKFKFLNEIKIT